LGAGVVSQRQIPFRGSVGGSSRESGVEDWVQFATANAFPRSSRLPLDLLTREACQATTSIYHAVDFAELHLGWEFG
jgi:hypothetical protein